MTAALEGVSGQQYAPAARNPGKDQVPILQEAGWAPGPVWTGGKCRPYRDPIPDRPARSQSLYQLRYPAQSSYGNILNIHFKGFLPFTALSGTFLLTFGLLQS
jgi:hypothetical protein